VLSTQASPSESLYSLCYPKLRSGPRHKAGVTINGWG